MQSEPSKSNLFIRHIALPQDHGSWVFLLSPLLIGLFAGGTLTLASIELIIAAMAVFLIRQPVSIAVKAYSGRRSRKDIPAARFWILVYGIVTMLASLGLVVGGFSYLFILAIPGVLVFAWYLYLVSRRAERRKVGVEIVASGVMALAAPAAYWVGIGSSNTMGWWLLALTWMQSAASIVHAYLRLEQRALPELPNIQARFEMGRRAFLYTTFNLLSVIILAFLKIIPSGLPIPYALQWGETLYSIFRPAIGVKPTSIGFRQLAISSLFTILFILTWLLT